MIRNREIKLSDLYKAIEIVRNEIKMKENTLREMDEINKKTPPDVKKPVSSIAKDLIIETLDEKCKELAYLESLAKGETYTNNVFVNNDDENEYMRVNTLEKGEVARICGFSIKEPVSERLFLVHGLEKFDVTVSDVKAYNDCSNSRKLTLRIRNNVVNCPIVNFDDLSFENKSVDTIEIVILDATLEPVYKIIYDGVMVHSLGDLKGSYGSDEQQTFDVNFTYRKRKMEKIPQ